MLLCCFLMFFFFNDPATTEIYTLSLHDALPIWTISARGPPAAHRFHRAGRQGRRVVRGARGRRQLHRGHRAAAAGGDDRSEEHTSELQSRLHLVCRLLLEKKKKSASYFVGVNRG